LLFNQIRVMHVRRTIMTTFTIDKDNTITAFDSPEAPAAASTTPFDSFASQKELAELVAGWPEERLVATWNSLPGVTPVKTFKSPKTAVGRIWERIQSLGDAAKPEAEPAKPRADKSAKAGARAAKGAPSKGKSGKKATAAKNAPKSKTPAKAEESGPREGSKTAQVVALLQRKNGATLTEIMEKMGWQRHTVRGFMAGAMKKAGYAVESFKSDKGDRTYRINQ
jgi:hypothetical protein